MWNRYLVWLAPGLVLLAACSGEGESTDSLATGGTSAGGGGSAAGGVSASGGNGASSTGGASSGGAGLGGEEPSGGSPASGGSLPVDCSNLAEVPAEFTELSGFTSSEDFVFDESGNYVGVDENNNLVRVDKSGNKTLWAPGIGQTAGMATLPDGSLIVADVGNGALKRVRKNGSSEVVLGGLLYPNGLDIGPDGHVYVAENFAGRVRRVDPDTGTSTVVAIGLEGANGVAFSGSPGLLYVGSFEGSGIFRVEIPAPGKLGSARVFARPHGSVLSEPRPACDGRGIGDPCSTTTGGFAGSCQVLVNVLDCVESDPCTGKGAGDACGTGAKCQQQGGSLLCVPEAPCQGRAADDDCFLAAGAGKCVAQGGSLTCELECEDADDGEACQAMGGSIGLCSDGKCRRDLCARVAAGAPCLDESFHHGTCQAEGTAKLRCVSACSDVPEGGACQVGSASGTCFSEDCELTPVIDAPGGIDGLGVDACGNVYASEFTNGLVWRASASGLVEELVDLPSGWIPNLKWGRGLGGFEREVLYVADRDEGRLFAIQVGVPGVTEFYDLGAQ